MSQTQATAEQRRKRQKKAIDKGRKLEQGHLDDQPEPLTRPQPSEALGRLPPMDLIK